MVSGPGNEGNLYFVYVSVTTGSNVSLMFNISCRATCPTMLRIIFVASVFSERHLVRNRDEWRAALGGRRKEALFSDTVLSLQPIPLAV